MVGGRELCDGNHRNVGEIRIRYRVDYSQLNPIGSTTSAIIRWTTAR